MIIGLVIGFLFRKAIGDDCVGKSTLCGLSPGDVWDGASCDPLVKSMWLMDGREMVGINGGLMTGGCGILDGAILLLSLRGGTGGLR